MKGRILPRRHTERVIVVVSGTEFFTLSVRMRPKSRVGKTIRRGRPENDEGEDEGIAHDVES